MSRCCYYTYRCCGYCFCCYYCCCDREDDDEAYGIDEEAERLIMRLSMFEMECDTMIHSSRVKGDEVKCKEFELEKERVRDMLNKIQVSKYQDREVEIRKEITVFLNNRIKVDPKLIEQFNNANLKSTMRAKMLEKDVHPFGIYENPLTIGNEEMARSLPSVPSNPLVKKENKPTLYRLKNSQMNNSIELFNPF